MLPRAHKIAIGVTAVLIFLAVGAYVASNEMIARQRGFSDWAEQSAATRVGIATGAEWRQKLENDARRREEEEAEASRRSVEAAEEKLRKDRASLFDMLRVIDKTPFWQKKSYATLKEAYGVINDFKLADTLMVTALAKDPSAQERRLIEAVEKKVKAGRRAAYPTLRSAFGRFAQDMLWSEDYKVRVGGKRSEIINFYHRSFVLNRNIQHAQEKIRSSLNDFNFHRACYSWNDSIYAEGTCYTVSASSAP